jgi:deoxyadenosine/deoxycytidine kinase
MNCYNGETYLADAIKSILFQTYNNFEVIREPVDLWLQIKGSDGKNLLQQFYEEPDRYSYLFQTMVFKTRLESLDNHQNKPYRFSERSIWTDRYVFGKSCINSKKMKELKCMIFFSCLVLVIVMCIFHKTYHIPTSFSCMFRRAKLG